MSEREPFTYQMGGEKPEVGDLVIGIGPLGDKLGEIANVAEDGRIDVLIGDHGRWWSLPGQWRLLRRGSPPAAATRHDERTVELARCVHCGAHVVNPTSDECPMCKWEIYPVTKILQPGSYVLLGGEWCKPDGTKVFAK